MTAQPPQLASAPASGTAPAPRTGARDRIAAALARPAAPWWALAAITLAGLGLRIAGLGQSLFADELYTELIATRPSLSEALDLVRSDLEITPPLNFVLAWLATRLGDGDAWLRLPSLIAGTAAIPLTYLLGARTAGRAAGLAGAALLALSPFAIFFSVEARAYALMMALVCASTLALVLATREGRARWWILFAACCAGALYAHYTAALVVGAQGVWALAAHPRRWRAIVLSYAGVAAAYAPWVPSLLADRDAGAQATISFLDPFSAEAVARNLVSWLDGLPYTTLGQLPGTAGFVLLGIAALAAVAGAADRMRRPGRGLLEGTGGGAPDRRALVLLVVTAAATPLGALLYSIDPPSIFISRNLMASLPALLVCAGALIAWIRVPFRALAAAALVAAFAVAAVQSLGDDMRRPAYREAAAFIDATVPPGAPVLELNTFAPGAPPSRALSTQLERDHPLFQAGGTPGIEEAIAAADGGPLYVVTLDFSRSRLAEPIAALVRERMRPVLARYAPASSRSFDGLLPLVVTEMRPRADGP